jgi:hypothetical protein
MKLPAISQARARLDRAKAAQKDLVGARGFAEAEAAWTTFLISANAIYAKLEQGAKGCGKSTPWFGRMKNERKKDDLLRYLHFARNTEEHSIAPGTTQGGENYSFDGRQLEFGEVITFDATIVDGNTGQPKGPSRPAAILGPNIVLVRVRNEKFDDFCDPPYFHKGDRLDHMHPSYIADLAILYLIELIEQAGNLPEH